MNSKVLIALLLAIGAGSAMAQTGGPAGGPPQMMQGQGGPGGGHPHGPPPEAFQACAGKAVGTACAMVGFRGEQMNGSCDQPPGPPAAVGDQKSAPQLACRPANMPRPMGGQRPPPRQ